MTACLSPRGVADGVDEPVLTAARTAADGHGYSVVSVSPHEPGQGPRLDVVTMDQGFMGKLECEPRTDADSAADAARRLVEAASLATATHLQDRLRVGASMLGAVDAQLGRVESAIAALREIEQSFDRRHEELLRREQEIQVRIDTVDARARMVEHLIERAELNASRISVKPAAAVIESNAEVMESVSRLRAGVRQELQRLSTTMHEAAQHVQEALEHSAPRLALAPDSVVPNAEQTGVDGSAEIRAMQFSNFAARR